MLTIGLILGSVFYQQEVTDVAGVGSRVGMLGITLTVMGTYNVIAVIPFMYTRKALFYREKASNMYSPTWHAAATGIVELPFIFVEATIVVNVMYWMVGFGPMDDDPAAQSAAWWIFLYFWADVFLLAVAMTFLGMMLTNLLPNPASAQLVSALLTNVLGMFAGQATPVAQIQDWLYWLSYAAVQRWATEGVISTQFQYFNSPLCYPSGIPNPANQTCLAPDGSVIAFGTQYMTVREYVFSDPTEGYSGALGGRGGYQYSYRFYDLLFMLCFIALVRVITMAASHISFQKR